MLFECLTCLPIRIVQQITVLFLKGLNEYFLIKHDTS